MRDIQLVILLGTLALLVNFTSTGPVSLRDSENWNVPSLENTRLRRSVRTPTVSERPGCKPGATAPANRVNTTQRLSDLRKQFDLHNVTAYIVTSDNAHQGEEVSPHDHRREYISGLSGSSGTAVITKNAAALWTDGRYFLQAEAELDCNWILMKQGEAGVPSITEWLKEVLTSSDTVAADPTLIGTTTWLDTAKQLGEKNITFHPLKTNLIDEIWTVGRPPANTKPGFVLHLNYSGVSWQTKVDLLRAELPRQGADALVITALDEVAWLLNIRGFDVPNHPVILGYMYVSANQLVLFAEESKINSTEMKNHLSGVTTTPYDKFVDELPNLIKTTGKVLIPSQFVYTGGSSYAVYNAVPEAQRLLKTSPVLMMKAKKNSVEAEGMMNAHLKDALALCDFISLLAEEVPKGINWTELKVSEELLKFREKQAVNQGASFETIAGYGSNGAIIHYSPSEETNKALGTDNLFLLDSGGQYYDGTTDVTRTLHFGTPTSDHIRDYTLVLMGHVDLARLVFPKTTKDSHVDALARAPLYDKGLDYLHGTGHGIGHFGSIHESPSRVSIGSSTVENKFEENYFFSDEPGYYKSGAYGIRIESILRVVNASCDTEFPGRFYKFQPVTLVPFERKLINVNMLSQDQIDYVNEYYVLIRNKVGKELQSQGKTRAYDWLWEQTAPLEYNPISSKASITTLSSFLGVGVVAHIFQKMFFN